MLCSVLVCLSSMRSTANDQQVSVDIEPTAAPPANGGKKPAKPPKYSELYETGSTGGSAGGGRSNLGTPPRYSSKTPSVKTSQENVTQPKPKIIKPKKKQAAKVAPAAAEAAKKEDNA